MEKTVKTLSIISIVLGGLAILGSAEPVDGYGLIGGAYFLAYGIVTVIYVGQKK